MLYEKYNMPEYGGPIVTLPPDFPEDGLSYSFEFDSQKVPSAWHQFSWIKEKLWPLATGAGILVAVLDTGYTKHAYGPDPIAQRSFISGQSVSDGNGHGTHCIGTVLCRRDADGNSIGIAPDADLLVGKVLSNQGSGPSDGITAGIRWAVDNGAHIISMSLGGGSSYGPTNEAIDYAWSKGCWVVAAAGNSGFNGSNTIGWPAKYENCLCTGSYDQSGNISNFSSGGREIDWALPGSSVISFSTNGTGWRTLSGTSMATPGGAGFLACMYQVWRGQGRPAINSAKGMRDYFQKTLRDAGAPGFDFRFGWGKVDENFLVEAIIKDLVLGA